MKDFLNAATVGFGIGIVLGVLMFVMLLFHVDIPVTRIKAAEAVCVAANSTIRSVDYYEVTCENNAVIPYQVQK
jgi:hypothetical protein